MSYTFSKLSKDRLASCHPDLQTLFNHVINHVDCSVLCGHRNKFDQDAAVAGGKSKARWPNSKHNAKPSLAVDVVPYPVDWDNINAFYEFAGRVKQKADELGIKVRWGGDFDGFFDGPHWELVT